MKKLSDIVEQTKKISKERKCGFPEAAIIALRNAGYPNHRQQVGVTYYINNDISANERYPLDKAILAELGKRGGNATASNHEADQLFLKIF